MPINKNHNAGPRLKGKKSRQRVVFQWVFAGLLAVGVFQNRQPAYAFFKSKVAPPAQEDEMVRSAQRTDCQTYCVEGYFGTEVFVSRRRLILSEYKSGRLEAEERVDTFYVSTLSPGSNCPPYSEDLVSASVAQP